MLSSGKFWKAVVCCAGFFILEYCFHFDRKRRSDPLFKQKLRERRKPRNVEAAKLTKKPMLGDAESFERFDEQELDMASQCLWNGRKPRNVEAAKLTKKPMLGDAESFERFYEQELDMASQCLLNDEFEDAAEHFAYVFAVHPEPDRMLRVLQGYIPPTLIQSIKSLIPVARRDIFGSKNSAVIDSSKAVMQLIPDDDLE